MCRPASMIATKGKVFWSTKSEGHEDIIEEYELKERDIRDNIRFVRIEIIPPSNDFRLPFREWEYHLDQDILPDWYDAKDVEKRCRAKLEEWRKAKIVMPNEKRKICQSDYIVAVYGTIESVRGGIIESVDGGTIESVYGGTIKYVRGGTIEYVRGQFPKAITGKATIITYSSSLDPNILKSSQAVLIDRTKDPVVCYVGN